LVYRGKKLAAIEAKSDEKEASDGVGQAVEYANRLELKTTFSTIGNEIYQICMVTSQQGAVDRFPTPQELGTAPLKKRTSGEIRLPMNRTMMSAARNRPVSIKKMPSTQ